MSKELNNFFFYLMAFISSIVLSYLFCRLLIRVQKKKKISQPIHSLGVKNHFSKSGTPSLGGVGIILSVLILFMLLGFNELRNRKLLTIILSSLSFFFVGLFDDLIKVIKNDEHGLSATLRIGIEVALVFISLVLLNLDESYLQYLYIYPTNIKVFIGILAVFLVVFVVLGASNSSNLMDGLDGLDGGVMMISFLPILVLSLKEERFGLSLFLILVVGGIIGFLILNSHPAKIFMGDCGSLFLGSLLAWSLIFMDKLILLPFVGLLYVIEASSVILQVTYYKATKRRILLMAPLHHHFELKGIKEYQIVMGYFLVQCIISIIVIIMGVLF